MHHRGLVESSRRQEARVNPRRFPRSDHWLETVSSPDVAGIRCHARIGCKPLAIRGTKPCATMGYGEYEFLTPKIQKNVAIFCKQKNRTNKSLHVVYGQGLTLYPSCFFSVPALKLS